jgi:hypothetical protein
MFKCTSIFGKKKVVSFFFRNNSRSVGIAMGYGQNGRGSIPSRDKRFFSSPQRPDRLSSGKIRQGLEVDHSSQSLRRGQE